MPAQRSGAGQVLCIRHRNRRREHLDAWSDRGLWLALLARAASQLLGASIAVKPWHSGSRGSKHRHRKALAKVPSDPSWQYTRRSGINEPQIYIFHDGLRVRLDWISDLPTFITAIISPPAHNRDRYIGTFPFALVTHSAAI